MKNYNYYKLYTLYSRAEIKNLINNLSIKHKLVSLSMATSVIATFITYIVFTTFYIASERSDLLNEVKLVTRIFSEELSDYVMDKEEAQIKKSLNALKNRTPFIQTCVFLDKNKEKLAEQKKEYRAVHKEEASKAQKEWREANKEKLKEQKMQIINSLY